jgi:chromosome partitioning protein
MIVTVASFKGGVGKTTTAVHLGCYLQKKAPTLLIDGDENRSATGWNERGGLPFKVVDELQGVRYTREDDLRSALLLPTTIYSMLVWQKD